MYFFEALRESPGLLLFSVGAFGLLVGSFLNVVILRLPVMLEREWRRDCEEFLYPDKERQSDAPFNLIIPRSHCPKCGHLITAIENIPIVSYLILRGKCRRCGARISLRYPVIEAVTAALFMLVAWTFGAEWKTLAGITLTAVLVCLTVIDFDRQLLPDVITLPILWLGLLINTHGLFVDSATAVIGAAAGYLSLWLTYHLFKLVTGKEGMGYGDFKLLAALGAWLGWTMLPLIILLSSLVGAAIGVTLIALLGRDRNLPIPFGPYLAIAGFIAMLWGKDILAFYLTRIGIAA